VRPLQLAHFKLYLVNAIELEAHRHGLFNGSTSPSLQWPRGATERLCGPLFGSVLIAVTGAWYSSSASAPNLDPIAFKEAALARLRNVAVSFESGAAVGPKPRQTAFTLSLLESRGVVLESGDSVRLVS